MSSSRSGKWSRNVSQVRMPFSKLLVNHMGVLDQAALEERLDKFPFVIAASVQKRNWQILIHFAGNSHGICTSNAIALHRVGKNRGTAVRPTKLLTEVEKLLPQEKAQMTLDYYSLNRRCQELLCKCSCELETHRPEVTVAVALLRISLPHDQVWKELDCRRRSRCQCNKCKAYVEKPLRVIAECMVRWVVGKHGAGVKKSETEMAGHGWICAC